MNVQLKNMLQGVLAGVTFVPAKPDHLAIVVDNGQSTSYQENVGDHQLMLDLYAQVFNLPETAAQPDCPPESDKLAGKGTHTTLTFIQWDLPLVRIDTYEGSCS